MRIYRSPNNYSRILLLKWDKLSFLYYLEYKIIFINY
jgi:hypothetical protein